MTYDIGYGKPPQHGKFRKGRSGNPKGRPKRALNSESNLNIQRSLANALSKEMTVTENGVKSKITRLDGLMSRQVVDAMNGDRQAMKTLMKTLKDFGAPIVKQLNPDEELRASIDDVLERVMGKTAGLPHENARHSQSNG